MQGKISLRLGLPDDELCHVKFFETKTFRCLHLSAMKMCCYLKPFAMDRLRPLNFSATLYFLSHYVLCDQVFHCVSNLNYVAQALLCDEALYLVAQRFASRTLPEYKGIFCCPNFEVMNFHFAR